MKPDTEIRIAGIVRESIVDGPGFRFTIFTQGCPHGCEGCHNPQTHDFNGGQVTTIGRLIEEISKTGLLRGVTFSGGEPFCQSKPLAELATEIHAKGLDVISYTGYTYEQLINGANDENGWLDLLNNIDYLIDGRFVLAKKSLLIKYRGSTNQRIIDVKKSLSTNTIVEFEL
ncbi:MAG: anaerobic ribonucleoside-triphosphate reductase activating protein [Oscillospiraceae bacterium]|nr:anaerobic ribonucleoside-triphosphate reductase activating protein [Oscillospiraceae bacterium]